MDKVARLDARERNALFGETASAMRTIPAIVEKDFWVVWVLDKLFSDPELQRVLKFKGGTSLSKAFGLIGRFSEDIDLILDWREVTQGEPYLERSKSQQSQFNETINEQAVKYIREVLLPSVAHLLEPVCECFIEADDPHSIYVRYPAAFKDAYLRPEILLEIGPLASWLPSAMFTIQPYAAQHFPQVFERAECSVPTILAVRTFWEKATILHQEAHRDKDKPMPLRYSRHYYDLALLAKAEVKMAALADLALLEEVVEFKQRFYPSAWAKYELAVPGSFRIVPHEDRLRELERDFQAMQNMIFDKPLSFEAMMDALSVLEKEINALGSKV
ncbi:nucleotidyl transferase AbiEii/AbiGii toxin family protein [Nitrosomonas sp.]|uniref:nucleotidyl transferase AbiEii/AbiGii toxin family protein n=2 Tax=Nitrosomonas sp. TaxID=42353 RepID=UPI00271887A1|nr:nucleotidyl transferase AbiEii/AbiGii toxin family protein [Nitrosomonas sp.]MDO8895380.1 nucleotidyl transferase AbiEii/AbiGii toxin family protein [Nitrosomonas sp.]